MDFNQYGVVQKLDLSAFYKLCVSVLLVFSMLIVIPVTQANGLASANNMSLSQSEQSLDNLTGSAPSIIEEEKNQQNTNSNPKSKPSWWNWLTNASKKPANFHYIDFIELLS